MTTTMNTITTTDNDEIREWLQWQIKGCLKKYGIQEILYPVIQNAIAEITPPLSDRQRETCSEALDRLRETDWKLGQRQWGEARSYLTEAHNDLQAASVAVDSGSGVSWRRELDAHITELIESIDGAQLEPGSPEWRAWRGTMYSQILLDQPYYQDNGLIDVLQSWEYGLPVSVVDGELTATIITDDDQD